MGQWQLCLIDSIISWCRGCTEAVLCGQRETIAGYWEKWEEWVLIIYLIDTWTAKVNCDCYYICIPALHYLLHCIKPACFDFIFWSSTISTQIHPKLFWIKNKSWGWWMPIGSPFGDRPVMYHRDYIFEFFWNCLGAQAAWCHEVAYE